MRTILQHAWAEIEHKLHYEDESYIPWENRRQFARIAGLLELADNEFDKAKTAAAKSPSTGTAARITTKTVETFAAVAPQMLFAHHALRTQGIACVTRNGNYEAVAKACDAAGLVTTDAVFILSEGPLLPIVLREAWPDGHQHCNCAALIALALLRMIQRGDVAALRVAHQALASEGMRDPDEFYVRAREALDRAKHDPTAARG